MTTGKWTRPDVPHRGWTCIDVYDDGSPPSRICEMCEKQEIRYVHVLEHPEYDGPLSVGCICAEAMEEDYTEPREREQRLKGIAARRRRWEERDWDVSAKGNYYTTLPGYVVAVIPDNNGGWRLWIKDRSSERRQRGSKSYPTEGHAMIAGFDAVLWMEKRQ